MPYIPLQKWGFSGLGPPITQVRNVRGGVTTEEIILAGGTKGIIRSQNYDPYTTGWGIFGDGTANFSSDVAVGGTFFVGEGPSADRIELNAGSGTLHQIQFFHEGNSNTKLNSDNEGLLWSDFDEDSGGLFRVEAPNKSDQAKGTLNVRSAPDVGSGKLGDFTSSYNSGSSVTGTWLFAFSSTPTHIDDGIVLIVSNTNGLALLGLGGDPDGGGTVHGQWEGVTAPGGWLIDQTNGFLPATEYAGLTDLTTISASTFTTIDSANRPVILHGSSTNKVRAYAEGNVVVDNTAGSTTTLARARMRISLDSGSTWTNGKAARVDVAAGLRASLHPGQQLNGTPTGNIVAELQAYTTDTDTDFVNSWARVEAFGDL